MTVSQVNQLNRAFTVVFTNAMQSIKPKTDIEKLRNKNTDEQKKSNESYRNKLMKWQSAFAFRLDLRSYINNLNNILVLAGSTNSEGKNPFTKDSLVKLEKFLKSDDEGKSFAEYMDSCVPDSISEEENSCWKKEFTFPSKLDELLKKLANQVKENKIIPAEEYSKQIDEFIKELASNEDEFLIEETDNVGGEGYRVSSEVIIVRAKKESEVLKDKIHKDVTNENRTNYKVSERIKKNFLSQEATFTKVMKNAKANQLEVKAKKKILEKKYDNPQLKFEIDVELAKKGAQAAKKHFPQYMNWIAAVSIVAILALSISSVLCIGCTSEIVSIQETVEIRSVDSTDVLNQDLLETASSEGVTEIHKNTVIRNPATEILESELILVLISTFVAPIATRIIKEKFDIDVTEKQINMIMTDGIKATTSFAKEADKLRDENGHIPRKYQKTLRDKAFTALRGNYTKEKYLDIVSNVGSEVFEKAIESAVASEKLKKFPLEKKQVELLIKQSITAAPGIVEWQKLDEEAKKIFIDGNIRKLLQNAGINGWSYSSLENLFDGEVNQRLINAALIEKNNIFQSLDLNDDPYLKYAVTATDAFLEQFLSPPGPTHGSLPS